VTSSIAKQDQVGALAFSFYPVRVEQHDFAADAREIMFDPVVFYMTVLRDYFL
jgi:hypothetical protein